ncbi:MAG TPA: hypothetical protein VFD19_01170, partial [Clostridia bacterium]|nr:hypothetical protein [Clostridia bacterium]
MTASRSRGVVIREMKIETGCFLGVNMDCHIMDMNVFASAGSYIPPVLLSFGGAIALTVVLLILSGLLVAFLKATKIRTALPSEEKTKPQSRGAKALAKWMKDAAKLHREVMTAQILL